VLSAANIAVTVSGIVAVIAFRAGVDSKLSATPASGLTAGGLSGPVIRLGAPCHRRSGSSPRSSRRSP
jgi:hypothetical protein